MAGRIDFSNITLSTLRHKSALITLRKVRKGDHHVYVELRQDGKRYVFFCILCHAPCYSDTTLDDHLRGRKHNGRLAFAKATLLLPNPWPFNDGVFFFHDSDEQGGNTSLTLKHNMDLIPYQNGNHMNGDSGNSGNRSLIIPGVLRNDKKSSLNVKLIGFGEIGSRIREQKQTPEEISRMWCAWLGNKSFEDDEAMLPKHDFGVVIFRYDYDLGRKPLLGDFQQLCASDTCLEGLTIEGKNKRRRKSLSESEDICASFSTNGDSSGEGYHSSGSPDSESLLNPQLLHSKSARRRLRREMRQQQSLAAERLCDICHIKILPGKDVACLLNTKTGRLACSSRNTTGAFHLFHTSCLVHWILLCEHEIWKNHRTIQEAPLPVKKTRGRRSAKKMADKRVTPKQISSVFCPECQGTGINVEKDKLEKPSFLLSEMFLHKVNLKNAKEAWIEAPEILQNCSIGLHFLQSEEIEEPQKVARQKMLHFYRADVQN